MLLFVDHADDIASAVAGHRYWAEALRLGFNELDINVKAVERVDRLLLRGHIIRRWQPLLNVLDEATADSSPVGASALRSSRHCA